MNLLLRKDAQIVPKGDERLTTELRILALIRLGISDNVRISSILRASLTTVYTYRSKLKARAFDHGSFESAVKRIGSRLSFRSIKQVQAGGENHF